MSFPGHGSGGGWFSGILIVVGLAAIAWRISPVLFWAMAAVMAVYLFYPRDE